jgi:hypothetical protein
MRAPQAAAFAGTFVLAIADLDPLVITMTRRTPSSRRSRHNLARSTWITSTATSMYRSRPSVARIKLKRSITTGAKPTALAAREIALNEADGVLYSRNGTGALKATPYLGFGKGRLRPPGGADGEVLGVDFTWKAPPTAGGAPAQIKPPAATRVLLANNFLGVSADRPLQTVADGKYAVHYRPFFLPKATHLTALSVFQEPATSPTIRASASVARFRCASGSASAPGTPTSKQPGATQVAGADRRRDRPRQRHARAPVDVTLPVGWYAAMIGAHNTTYLANQGSTLATFQAWRGGLAIGPNFVPRGEAYGLQDIGSSLSTPPADRGLRDGR